MALGLAAEDGVAVLRLEGWVEATALRELDPGSSAESATGSQESQDPPANPAPPAVPPALVLHPGTALRWPDGRVAGEILEQHVMYEPAVARASQPGHEDSIPLACHEHRRAPTLGAVDGWLCVHIDDLGDAGTVDPSAALALDDPPDPASKQASSPPVRGALPREVIRKIVRNNIEDVRDCYNIGLSKDPTLAGRVAINFVISGSGEVSSAVVQDDKLSDPEVGRCIAARVSDWVFPKPEGGGNVIVTYPFELTTD